MGLKIPYKNRPKEYIKKAAATFSQRSFAGKGRAIDRAHIQGEEWMAWSLMDDEEKASGDYIPDRGGILGMADRIMRASKGRFGAFPLHLWRRRDLHKRLVWLRGELTRLMTNEPPFNGTPSQRTSEIERRKAQIRKYEDALDELKPLHDEIERQRRVFVQWKRRIKKQKNRRRTEIKEALKRSRAALLPQPPSSTIASPPPTRELTRRARPRTT